MFLPREHLTKRIKESSFHESLHVCNPLIPGGLENMSIEVNHVSHENDVVRSACISHREIRIQKRVGEKFDSSFRLDTFPLPSVGCYYYCCITGVKEVGRGGL